MKFGLLMGVLLFSGLVHAQDFKEWEVVYDKLTKSSMNVDYTKNGIVYLKNPKSPELSYYSLPRDPQDLVKRVGALGEIKEGDQVSFFNPVLKRYDVAKVRFVYENGLADIHLTTFNDAQIRDYLFISGINILGFEIPSIAGLDLKVGEKACPKERTPRHRRGGSAGTAVKFYSNGTVLLFYRDFFLQKNYEAIPLENLSLKCNK
ncbi:hypothetical protein D3C87_377380 [compost metagenome]